MAAKAKRTRKHSIILAAVAIAFTCYCIASIINIQAKIKTQQAIVDELEITYRQQVEENELLREMIENGDEASFMEKIAREQYGYAKPEERVYFDSSAS